MITPTFHKPFVIGVAGGTGSGKTTIVKKLVQALNSQHVQCISHDDYYRDQSHLSPEDRAKTNYDHPNAFETELLVDHLHQLMSGESVQGPTYDFVKHTRSTKTLPLKPASVIIVEGILIFESKLLRNVFDLKVFVDTDADVRFIRRMIRDIQDRGREFEYVIHQYLTIVRPMHLEFVEPSRRYADIIVPEGGENTVALDLLLARVRELVKGE